MSVNDALRLLAGTIVLLSLGLVVYVSINFLWLTAFAGANLFQSAFTKWCPAVWFFRKLGLREC
ncbi:MAG: DUF2892 domain-containing protein [Elusimicrobia bacterium CG08_land_8_20_14_0_20_59_10]|nr:MAG: DUF2892 domain-containing protein [Elusimicrobia bacterium CG08_land_8_20_14_0_20_59_10]